MLKDVKIQKQKNTKSVKEESTSSSSEKKKSNTGIRFCRVGRLKVLCHQPVRADLIVTKNEDPYVIEVEPEDKKKKTKVKLKTIKELEKEREKEKVGVFDPKAHILGVLGKKSSVGSSREKPFLMPMPYNEKLRLGGRENSRVIAETQVSTMEVLRGRYRKTFREYPARRIGCEARRKIDLSGDFLKSNGLCLTSRQYSVALSGQDRDLAEMAVAASGSLSLLGHNIIVVGREAKGLVKREPVSTRRRQRIEEVSYDVKNNYEPIKRSLAQSVRDTSESSCESSCEEDQLRRSSRSCVVKARKQRRKNDPKSRKKRGQDEFKAAVPQSNIKMEAADEENNEVEDVLEPGIKVEEEKQEWYQPDIEEFFDQQEGGPDQMDKDEADELLGFLQNCQERPGEVPGQVYTGDSDILWEEVMREEGDERPLLEIVSETVDGLEVKSSDYISVIDEFNLLE